jgi:quercetin dioxygenase-like cupin family protein
VTNRRVGKIAVSFVVAAATLSFPPCMVAGDTASFASPTVVELMTRELAGVPNKEALMMTVKYLPSGASLPHRHDAQVFVYVLEGAMTMQVDGSAPVTLKPGQVFYEGPSDIHRISANASQTAAAKILVFMIKDKGKPASRVVGSKEAQ